MKIFLICSKAFYCEIEPIKKALEEMGHEIVLPNSYDNPGIEKQCWENGTHNEFKAKMFRLSREKIGEIDAVLTLNYDKHGVKNYIGGATFLELYEAFMQNKKIYLMNDIPQGILFDEIEGFSPIIINGNLNLVK